MGCPSDTRRPSVRLSLSTFPKPWDNSRGFAASFSQSFKPRHECLLWVKEFGIFKSSENLHLYYRLRQSYGDLRLLHEANGHLFLEYEDADLASFLQIGIVNGWDMHVFPALAYGGPDTARAVICHDEWIALHHRQESAINEWRESLHNAKYRLMKSGNAP